MQVSVETLGNLERRMTFRLPAERIDTQVGGRLREIARTARIKGFRPGKVPTKVIEQRYGTLSEREVEVLQLLAQGLSNADIAAHLVVSPRTVAAHLRSVFTKLGVATRTAAAHEAVRIGIARRLRA